MAKIKYDVSGVETRKDYKQPSPGLYAGKVHEIKMDDSKPTLVVVTLEITEEGEFQGSRVWERFYTDREAQSWRLATFTRAIGLTDKGTLDTDKITKAQPELMIRVEADTYNGAYQARVGGLFPVEAEGAEEESEPEEEGGEELDLDSMDRTALKGVIKDYELDIRVTRGMSDDKLRAAIADALNEEPEEEEPEAEEADEEPENGEAEGEEAEAEGEDYNDWSEEDLRVELTERNLSTKGSKKVLVARLVKDDNEE